MSWLPCVLLALCSCAIVIRVCVCLCVCAHMCTCLGLHTAHTSSVGLCVPTSYLLARSPVPSCNHPLLWRHHTLIPSAKPLFPNTVACNRFQHLQRGPFFGWRGAQCNPNTNFARRIPSLPLCVSDLPATFSSSLDRLLGYLFRHPWSESQIFCMSFSVLRFIFDSAFFATIKVRFDTFLQLVSCQTSLRHLVRRAHHVRVIKTFIRLDLGLDINFGITNIFFF